MRVKIVAIDPDSAMLTIAVEIDDATVSNGNVYKPLDPQGAPLDLGDAAALKAYALDFAKRNFGQKARTPPPNVIDVWLDVPEAQATPAEVKP